MYVTVDVDADDVLNQLDSDDLKGELDSRGEEYVNDIISKPEIAALVQKYQVALYQGDKDKALQMAQEYFYKVHNIGV